MEMDTTPAPRSVPRYPAPPAPAKRSAERARLAAALAAEQDAVRSADSIRQADVRVEDMVAKAETRLRATRGGAEAAQEEMSERLADAAMSGTPAALEDVSMREAREAEADAADSLTAVRAAFALLTSRSRQANDAVTLASDRVAAAADAVLRTAAKRVLTEAKAAVAELRQFGETPEGIEELRASRAVLRFMLAEPTDTAGAQTAKAIQDCLHAGEDFLTDRAGRLREDSFAWRRHPRLAPWRAARDALLDDVDAPLPEA
jgi:hypothetical protein